VWADAVRRNPRLALVNNELAGAKQSSGKLEETSSHEKQADQFTPNDPLYHWVLGRRLRDLGMTDLAEKHLQQANKRGVATEMPGEH
jgi:tetratricopeptide (TPR) repeat protein